jgi:hypothetical protein
MFLHILWSNNHITKAVIPSTFFIPHWKKGKLLFVQIFLCGFAQYYVPLLRATVVVFKL